ncbi:MAG: hypothetical protein AAFR42_08635 [Cyanobacteria bacterium J06628_6]
MSSPVTLTDAAVLGELLLEEAQVTPCTPGRTVVQQFEQRQHLPGVVVIDQGAVVGVISRRQLYQGLSQPYALEIFLRRPIRVFLDLNPYCSTPLTLSYQTSVQSGVSKALSRPTHALFEPILVEFAHPRLPRLRNFFLLDFHTLMLAHSQIAASANQQLRQQQEQLEQEQLKVETYAQQLEANQTVIQARNRQLERQQQQLVNQAQEIQSLNQRFMQIGELLSHEGKRAFQATFAGVNAICHHTDQIMGVGQRLETELMTVHETSHLIDQVSRQVHHLSVQAAIFANQACANGECQELSGFSYITEEISNLTQQTAEAGRQIELLAGQFRDRVRTFQSSAQSGTVTARSLIREIEQAAISLSELENIVRQNQAAQATRPDAHRPSAPLRATARPKTDLTRLNAYKSEPSGEKATRPENETLQSPIYSDRFAM